jgi:hypothetical protein
LEETIEKYYSKCDMCKIQRYGTVTTQNIDATCYHIPGCLNSTSIRSDLSAQKGVGDEKRTLVTWSGHTMTAADVSSSSSITHTVVITTSVVSNWTATNDKNASRVFTLFHELSHQLGANDHYCYGPIDGGPCSNTSCDTCYLGYLNTRDCVMSSRKDISTLSDAELYCSDCLEIIRTHLENHH